MKLLFLFIFTITINASPIKSIKGFKHGIQERMIRAKDFDRRTKSDYDLDDKHGSGVSIGESQNENVGKLGGKKTKFEKEVASNDKTARVIEKFATGVCSRGAAIKFKMSDKIKNGSR